MGIFCDFINVGVRNIHGLFSIINKTKLCTIDDYETKRCIKSFDILCIQEKLCGPQDGLPLYAEGYTTFFYINKYQRLFGGILIFLRKNLKNGFKIF